MSTSRASISALVGCKTFQHMVIWIHAFVVMAQVWYSHAVVGEARLGNERNAISCIANSCFLSCHAVLPLWTKRKARWIAAGVIWQQLALQCCCWIPIAWRLDDLWSINPFRLETREILRTNGLFTLHEKWKNEPKKKKILLIVVSVDRLSKICRQIVNRLAFFWQSVDSFCRQVDIFLTICRQSCIRQCFFIKCCGWSAATQPGTGKPSRQ